MISSFLSFQRSFDSIQIFEYLYLTRIIFEKHFLSSKSTLEANKWEECATAWKWPPLIVTSPHGVTLWTKKHWRLALFVFASVFEVAVDFFHENWFLYTGRNDVTISQTWEFLTPVYLCLLVCNFAVKLAFVPNLLAIVFAIKVWCQFHPHSFYQSFNGNCTTFTKGVSRVGR